MFSSLPHQPFPFPKSPSKAELPPLFRPTDENRTAAFEPLDLNRN